MSSASQAQRRFEGKSVIITGAAGDLGSTTARCFAEQGALLVLCDLAITEPKLKELTAELESLGSPVAIYAIVDVSNPEDVKKCVALAAEKFGGIDILFNNAVYRSKSLGKSVASVNPVHETDDEDFKNTQDVNVYGVFLMMKYVVNKMIESGKGGAIVNTSSISGLAATPYLFSYATLKFAIGGMTRSAAKSLGMHKIRVNAIAPFVLEGSMADGFFKAVTLKGKNILYVEPFITKFFNSYSTWHCDRRKL